MIIKRISIHNFMLIEDCDIELDSGLFFVIGQNNDEILAESNGSGKSMFCQTIPWVLFDHLSRPGMKKDDVVGTSDKYCSVEIELLNVETQDEYKITRYRKHPTHKNKVFFHVNGEDRTHHTGTDAVIESELGFSKNVFYHSGYIDSDKTPLCAETPSGMKKIVTDAIDLKRFDQKTKAARSKMKSNVSVKLDRLESLKKQGESSFETLVSHYNDKLDEINSFEKRKEEKCNKIIAKVDEVNDRLNYLHEVKQKKPPLVEKLKKIKHHLDECETAYTESKSIREKIKRVEGEISKLKLTISKIDVSLSSKQEQYDNVFNNPSEMCQYCGNHMQDKKIAYDMNKHLQKEIDQLQSKKIDKNFTLEKKEQVLDRLKEALEELEEQSDKYQVLSKKKNDLEKKLVRFEQVDDEIKRCNKAIQDLEEQHFSESNEVPDSLFVSRDRMEGDIEMARKNLETYSREIEELKVHYQDLQDVVQFAENVKKQIFNGFIYDFEESINRNLELLTQGDYSSSLSIHKDELRLSFTSRSSDDKRPFGYFSKGERAKISRCVQDALNECLNVGFLIDDEGLNGLDKEGVKTVLNYTTNKNFEKSTVLFVGHQDSLKGFFEDINQIHVTKEDGKVSVRRG